MTTQLEIDIKSIATTMEWMEQFKTNITQKKNEASLPWIEKFRPQTLDNIMSNATIIDTLKNFVATKQFPHIILQGPPGTGKTSTILACARELYGDNYQMMVLDINASEERGIEVVRNKISSFVTTKGCFFTKTSTIFKLVILDEADAMTTDAQAMLVSVIEKYAINVRFCLICNYIKKISPAIQSRCTVFKFMPLNDIDITNKIVEIATINDVTVTSTGIKTILQIAHGDMRKVLNILQATSMIHKIVNGENVANCIGYPNVKIVKLIYKSLKNDNFKDCYEYINNIITNHGYSLTDLFTELTNIIISDYMCDLLSQELITKILPTLRDMENNLITCQNENIQLTGLISVFNKCFQSHSGLIGV